MRRLIVALALRLNRLPSELDHVHMPEIMELMVVSMGAEEKQADVEASLEQAFGKKNGQR